MHMVCGKDILTVVFINILPMQWKVLVGFAIAKNSIICVWHVIFNKAFTCLILIGHWHIRYHAVIMQSIIHHRNANAQARKVMKNKP